MLAMLIRMLVLVVFGFTCHSTCALVVLQYHHVSGVTPKATSISPQLFASHLAYLEEKNFKIMAMDELVNILQKGQSLPDGTAVITFDDGYRSVFDTAYPLLKKRKWPFTVFINSKAHDEKNHLFMSWKELKIMAKNGATIANHTDSHPHLIRQQSYENFEQWQHRRKREIEFAQDRIDKEIGTSLKVFAYPFGEYDARLQSQLKEMGYLAFAQHSGPISSSDSLQALPRFAFGGGYGKMDDFVPKVMSLAFPEARIKTTDNNGRVLEQPELPSNVDRPVLRIASPLMQFIKRFNCYASGQGEITADLRGGVAVVRAKKPLPVGRSRYNCTADAGNGRFYWHSQFFIRRQTDGNWYNE